VSCSDLSLAAAAAAEKAGDKMNGAGLSVIPSSVSVNGRTHDADGGGGGGGGDMMMTDD